MNVCCSEKLSDEESDDESSENSDDSDANMAVDTPEVDQSERQAAMDKLVPGIEPSEYGKMPPSFYSNSQRVAPTTMESEVREEASNATSASRRSIRPPILPRDKYDGVDSDDESDEEGEADDESEEDKPQVEGDIEIDMDQEQDEFLEFARQALGISDDQWNAMMQERRDQGGELHRILAIVAEV